MLGVLNDTDVYSYFCLANGCIAGTCIIHNAQCDLVGCVSITTGSAVILTLPMTLKTIDSSHTLY